MGTGAVERTAISRQGSFYNGTAADQDTDGENMGRLGVPDPGRNHGPVLRRHTAVALGLIYVLGLVVHTKLHDDDDDGHDCKSQAIAKGRPSPLQPASCRAFMCPMQRWGMGMVDRIDASPRKAVVSI